MVIDPSPERPESTRSIDVMTVDFDEALAPFYLASCDITPTRAGLIALPRATVIAGPT